jgi:prenyltransferase beta subunit
MFMFLPNDESYVFAKRAARRSHCSPSRGASLLLVCCTILTCGVGLTCARSLHAAEEVLPKHVNRDTLKAVRDGLDYLARTQAGDGGWHDTEGGRAYPTAVSSLAGLALLASGNTPTRGRYAPQVQQATEFLLSCSTKSGLLTGANEDSGQPMHGHGFALLYLASVYGMESKQTLRTRTADVVKKGVALTARGQSPAGGWTYIPGSGDEGSVTVTQVQALRAAHNSGFLVPAGTIEEAVRYIERCSTPEGGIVYSLGSGGGPRLAISAAAIATLYNAGEYDAPVARRCLDYVWGEFKSHDNWSKGGGHDFYTHLYASQAFYMSGDKYWDEYYPAVRDQLLSMQNKEDGSWDGDGIGKTYGTAISLIVLQLPYKYLPVYQR